MAVTLYQAIRILSKGKYSVGPEGTMSTEDAVLLDELIEPEVVAKDPGFSAAERIRYKAYLFLDVMANTGGTGNIVEKKVKDFQWKVAQSKTKNSTSTWYDFAERMLADFGGSVAPSGVARCDSDAKGFDSTSITQYGEPAYSEYGEL